MSDSIKNEKKRKYADWAEEYPNYLILTHAGFFYMAWGRSAEVLNEVLDYTLAYTKRGVAYTGGTSLEIIEEALQVNRLNYIVIDRERIVERKEYESCSEMFYREGDFGPTSRAKEYEDISDEEQLYAIDALLSGFDPTTGEMLEEDHLVNERVIKAVLKTAQTAIERKIAREENKKPSTGTRWTDDEDAKLIEEYRNKMSISEMAELHERSTGAIKSRLIKLSEIEL